MTLARNMKTEKLFLKLIDEGYFVVYRNGTVLNTKTGNLLGTGTNGNYQNISYVVEPPRKQVGIGIHRLVWLVFKGPIPEGLEINHKNGKKHDNRLSNLELVTRSVNTQHAYDIGISPTSKQRVKVRLKKSDVRRIRRLYNKGYEWSQIANEYGITARRARNVTLVTWSNVA